MSSIDKISCFRAKIYQNFTVTEFVHNDAFLHHCINPTVESRHLWETWVQQHPLQRSNWMVVQRLVKAGEVVTKVSGVRSFERDPKAFFTMQHGQVNIPSIQVTTGRTKSHKTVAGVLLGSDQQVTFYRKNESFTKSFVITPRRINIQQINPSASLSMKRS